jgi:hypothetical protein
LSKARRRLSLPTGPSPDPSAPASAQARARLRLPLTAPLTATPAAPVPAGMLPCLTPEGKLLLDAPGELAMAPNGNGGVYMSLRDAGLLTRLEEAGVTSVFQFGVDNVLCHVADPTFLGFCALRRADCAAKTVPKREPHEPVGVLALAGARPRCHVLSACVRSLICV